MANLRAIASLALTLLMLAAPMMALYAHTPLVARAVSSGTRLVVYPYVVVKGQDVLFTVVQQSGSFATSATLYVEVKNDKTWEDDGYRWIDLPLGSGTIPKGAYLYLPADTSEEYLLGTNHLQPGKAYLLVADTYDASNGYTGAEFTVVSGKPPYLHLDGKTYNPSDILSIIYSQGSGAERPEFTVSTTTEPVMKSPGDTVVIDYYVPGNSVTFYWDYYGGMVLATGPGGYGEVTVHIPDAPEGFHFIVAVSDTGYGAFNVLYVKPTLKATPFSIQGKSGETITFTGKGFPANAKLDTAKGVKFTVDKGFSVGQEIKAQIVSGGTVDSKGNVAFTVRLNESLPPGTPIGGILNITVYYASGDVDYQPGGSFYQGVTLAPKGDGEDTIGDVVALSIPNAYGDESLIVFGATGSTIEVAPGSKLAVAVVNFPAYASVDIYVGYKKAGTIYTDARGAAKGTITVPELPGYDNSGAAIYYQLRAMAKVGGYTLVATGPTPDKSYKVEIQVTAKAYIEPLGYGVNGDYLVSGAHKIHILIKGLSPFAQVEIFEEHGAEEKNILGYAYYTSPQVLVGSRSGEYFIADADGTLEVVYTTYYQELFNGLPTGEEIDVIADAYTARGYHIGEYTLTSFYSIGMASLEYVEVVTSPAGLPAETLTLPHATYYVVHPGDYVEVKFTGLVPFECYQLYFNGAPTAMYDTANNRINCLQANGDGDAVVRFLVPNSSAVLGLDSISLHYTGGVLRGATVSGSANVIVASTGNPAEYGVKAAVYVYPTTASPGKPITIIGVNFVPGQETLTAGFSTIQTEVTPAEEVNAGSGKAKPDSHGAVAFEVEVPVVPAGDYVVYIYSTYTYRYYTRTIHVLPKASAEGVPVENAPLFKAAGQKIYIEIVGVEPNRAYMVYWSDSPDKLGAYISSIGVPGVGAPLTWFSNSNGVLDIEFTVPFGLIGETYYFRVVPADNPTLAASVTEAVPVVMIAPWYAGIEGPTSPSGVPYAIPGEVFTVDIDAAYLLDELGLTSVYNGVSQQASPEQMVKLIAALGKAYAKLQMPDGTVRLVPASMEPLGSMLRVSFVMPNAEEEGVVGLSFVFTVAYPESLWNESASIDHLLYNISSVELKIGGIKLLPGGGLVLASVTGSLADVVAKVDNAVTVITQTVDQLKPVIMEINDTVAYMNTTLGTVVAGIGELKEMVNGSTVKLVEMGNKVMAEIDGKAGDIMASLDALSEMVNESYVELEGGQAKILGQLGELTMNVGDLAQLIHSMGNEVMAEIDAVNTSIAHLIVMEGNEVVAELNTTLGQLKPLIVALNGTVAQLQTTLGTMQADLGKLLEGQATIEKLVVNQSGAVIAVIKTTVGEFNSTLTAALEMLEEGMAKLGSQAMAQLSAISDKIDTQATALSTKLDSIMASLSDLSSSVSTLSDKVDAVKATLSDVDSKLGSVSSSISTLSGKVDAVSKKLGDLSTTLSTGLSSLSSKATTIQSSVADVKSTLTDVKSTVSSLPGQISSVKSSVDNLAKSVNSLSSKVDTAVSESSTAKSRATVLGGTTAGLVIVNIIITALALARRPE